MFDLIIGSVGVAVLLIAFVLNLTRYLHEHHPAYLLMNIIGSGLAAWYALAASNVPFVVLEAVWGGAAIIRLIFVWKKEGSQ